MDLQPAADPYNVVCNIAIGYVTVPIFRYTCQLHKKLDRNSYVE